ncbi:TetM/TetW/TetO/TetS family tetracycline resistance ribosomal protection protein [Bovifimicola ammoniilytica]|jgi:ribosomal protection tetracycline resistance protein|nr:TetM/TetW/TetO/TetS family tetracycline resistance ribosomal protection protein [Bovifimicola ammoniilytica]MCU6754533.1 TetM/TetW/TetO/TetS family tetracycline resistance ribosomal protection protein [Bovifimicola ammoniilytica]
MPVKTVIGILAHVDAGKTTLSEALLYNAGITKALGRVDKGNAYLDTDELEKQRGITIFSKQAEFIWKDLEVTLVDTPGHVDFSAEMERTLQILDYAILVISASNGVQSHTRTLWELLKMYKVPTIIFVNKMDMPDTDKALLLSELKSKLDDSCIDFTDIQEVMSNEEVAMTNESLMEEFLSCGKIDIEDIKRGISDRGIFPCHFGSALKNDKIIDLLDGLNTYIDEKKYPDKFSAKVYKINRDSQGNRLTYIKVTGGVLRVKDIIDDSEEKINQIRIYSGDKYRTANEIYSGEVCAVTGLTKTYSGENLGIENDNNDVILEPVLMYRVVLPQEIDAAMMLPKLKQLEEEDPTLAIKWNEDLKEIQVCLMGEVQIEILKKLVLDRFKVAIEFDQGNVVYKETISNTVEGVGHFEPLRHYAEVHLRLEPGEIGSGLTFETECSEEILAKNWQRLILTHLQEREHKGVLTGSGITDMKITLVSGRAHLKHTEGGDFRQATYRAVRQGLKMAQSVLLEPYYDFRLEIPTEMLGRAMTDIERIYGKINPPENYGEYSVITGYAPVVTMRKYREDIAAYTKGQGKITCTLKGYLPCHNQEEIVEAYGYDSEADTFNPTGSVFCAHGAGFYVSYDKVYEYMHIGLENQPDKEYVYNDNKIVSGEYKEEWIGIDEVDAIINQTYNANKKSEGENKRNNWKKSRNEQDYFDYKGSKSVNSETREKYLLVDGYNVIFAWDDLKELAAVNIDGARGKLMDILCNYQAICKCELIVVFDAYRVKGHDTEISDYHNIHVVFTKEAETADQYIEKFAHQNGRKYNVTVATSDGLEQIIIRGQGCNLISSRELKEEIDRATKDIMQKFQNGDFGL